MEATMADLVDLLRACAANEPSNDDAAKLWEAAAYISRLREENAAMADKVKLHSADATCAWGQCDQLREENARVKTLAEERLVQIQLLREDLALALEELIDHNGDSIMDDRRKRVEILRAAIRALKVEEPKE
jgi:hypothetical protein